MSRKLIAHSPDLARLKKEGFEVRVRESFLLTSSVPYLNSKGELRYGILACELTHQDQVANAPRDHTMWWQGEYPHDADGSSIKAIYNPTEGKTLLTGFPVNHYFSAKPYDVNGQPSNYPDFYEKVKTYTGIISGPALRKYSDAVLLTEREFSDEDDDSPFLYSDTNSSRSEINAISDKVKGQRIAIIGAGGTGSYILDLVAKTMVAEIHLFDKDPFGQHNAFRAPGAASPDELDAKMKKVVYLSNIYSKMRKGIIAHPEFIGPANFHELDGMSFVFIAIDKTGVKRELFNYLLAKDIPFIDVGIGVTRRQDVLTATARVTAANARKNDHLAMRVDMGPGDDEEDEYNTNIQIAELNALNAALAVIHWKRQYGFYEGHEKAMHVQMAVEDLNIFYADDQP